MGNTLAAAHSDIQHSKSQFRENAFENMLGPPSKTMDASGAVYTFLKRVSDLPMIWAVGELSRDRRTNVTFCDVEQSQFRRVRAGAPYDRQEDYRVSPEPAPDTGAQGAQVRRQADDRQVGQGQRRRGGGGGEDVLHQGQDGRRGLAVDIRQDPRAPDGHGGDGRALRLDEEDEGGVQ
ncbi:hypothetical protein THAOC_04569, partial [Thalassiosira oceanica]